jgi:hypothetical protein
MAVSHWAGDNVTNRVSCQRFSDFSLFFTPKAEALSLYVCFIEENQKSKPNTNRKSKEDLS